MLLWEQDVAGSNPVTPMPETSVLTGSVAASPGRLFYCSVEWYEQNVRKALSEGLVLHTTFRALRLQSELTQLLKKT